ncbi:hypothetical protein K439DRAFT_1665865 [Ramaria rubella]|nr:hypothetical protein K439DRAFT_1665865 [Ramaria rubella]
MLADVLLHPAYPGLLVPISPCQRNSIVRLILAELSDLDKQSLIPVNPRLGHALHLSHGYTLLLYGLLRSTSTHERQIDHTSPHSGVSAPTNSEDASLSRTESTKQEQKRIVAYVHAIEHNSEDIFVYSDSSQLTSDGIPRVPQYTSSARLKFEIAVPSGHIAEILGTPEGIATLANYISASGAFTETGKPLPDPTAIE